MALWAAKRIGMSARNATGYALIMNHVRHHDHGPGPTANGPPACLAKPWAAAWGLYAAHAKARGYAAHLVPKNCSEALSGSCLPAACAD